MAATDYEGQIHAAYKAAFIARTTFVPAIVGQNNLIYFDTANQNPLKPSLLDGDCPQLLMLPGEFADSLFENANAYGMAATNFNASSTAPVLETNDVTTLFTITMPDLQLAPARIASAEFMAALRNAGPALGLSFVKPPYHKVNRKVIVTQPGQVIFGQSMGGGATRMVMAFTHTVHTVFNAADLQG